MFVLCPRFAFAGYIISHQGAGCVVPALSTFCMTTLKSFHTVIRLSSPHWIMFDWHEVMLPFTRRQLLLTHLWCWSTFLCVKMTINQVVICSVSLLQLSLNLMSLNLNLFYFGISWVQIEWYGRYSAFNFECYWHLTELCQRSKPFMIQIF